MKEYICKKDYYMEDDVVFSKRGDHVILLPDNCTVVNINGQQRTIKMPEIINDKEYFASTFETVAPKKEEDKVNHPSWYTKHPSGVECIDITEHHDFCIGNAIKYLWRAGLKTEQGISDSSKEIEDLEKAVWYINRKIQKLKKDGNI